MAKDYFSSPPHPTPHHSAEDLVSWIRLLRSRRVGPATFYRLMGEHGSADAAMAALPEIAMKAGVNDYKVCPEPVALAELKAAKLAGVRAIAIGTDEYPEMLANLPDAPPLIWVVGNADILKRPMIAIVGARNASSLGTRMARQLSAGLSEAGYVVVSGLARGIDTAAHIAACPKGTLAVMAGGVDVVYPAENAVLAQEILDNGVRLSEQPMGLQPQSRHFPQRNRIISGIARAVIVVEAAARSGSLITARNALDQNRDVLAVPGHPFDARASGCNMLIRDGATMARSVEDIIEVLDAQQTGLAGEIAATEVKAAPKSDRRDIVQLHTEILNRLGPSPVSEDQLIRDLDLSAAAVAPEIVALELEGKIKRQSGGLLSLMH